jgi:hypothetical protein
MNPILPGPHADPYDPTVPLWETTAGDEHFIDASSNVRTRTELEDRDEIPPELQQAFQQMLSKKKEVHQLDGFPTVDGLQMEGAHSTHVEFVAMDANQTEHSSPRSWQTHRGQSTTSSFTTEPSRVFEDNAQSSTPSPGQTMVDTQYATSIASDSNDGIYYTYYNALNSGSFQRTTN